MQRAKTIMIQGTASSVGKSILVTALCRIFHQEGWNVAPFKAQNMSLNSFVTREGDEIGRAQAVQAEAASVEPTVDMNPILLKPEADNGSQVIVRGRPLRARSGRPPQACRPYTAQEYFSLKEELWPVVTESLSRLLEEYDVVIIEGAGSPVEINLRDRDLVNMRVARQFDTPVLLVADIERGGVFASLLGTIEILEPAERELVKAFVINKFRGDLSLLTSGLGWLEERTGIPVAGVIPYFHDIHVAEEDSVSLELRRAMKQKEGYLIDIAVIGLPHISNFDDFDPLEQEDAVRVRYVEPHDSLGNPDLVILPGTKSTIADLQYLKDSGLARQIVRLAGEGTAIMGVCGGFQMLGESILDPHGVESREGYCHGLGFLPLSTTFQTEKSTHQVKGRVILDRGLLKRAKDFALTGYEIHMGQTAARAASAPFCIEERSGQTSSCAEGHLSEDGNVLGTYIHGLFHNLELRRAILSELAARKGAALAFSHKTVCEHEEYDKLASLVRKSLDMSFIYRVMGLRK